MPRFVRSAFAAVLACLVIAAPIFAQPTGKDAPKDAAPPPITADDAKKAADEAKKSGDDAGKAATAAKQTGNIAWMLTSTAFAAAVFATPFVWLPANEYDLGTR